MEELEAVTPNGTVLEIKKTSRLQSFTVNHPRTAKVVGIVAITAATMGAMTVWNNRKQIAETIDDHTPVEVTFEVPSKTA